MKITFTWDDGAPEDKKLFELHEKYSIPGLFFVPTKNCEGRAVLTRENISAAAKSPLLRFGGHTANHRYLTTVEPEDVAEELVSNKHYLEDTVGQEIPHFCLPGGRYTQQILDEAFRYYRTVRTADTMNFRNEGNLLKPTFHIYPRGKKSLIGNAWKNSSYGPLLRTLLSGSDYFQTVDKLIDYVNQCMPEVQIIFWGHSWEIDELGLWTRLEALMANLAGNYGNDCVPYDALLP